MIKDDTDEIDDLDLQIADAPMLAHSTFTEIEERAMALQFDEPEAELQLQYWLNLSSVLRARARQIRQRVENIAIKWIESNGPLVAGDLQYSVGYRREVKCVDRRRAFDLILASAGGDLGALVDYLRSDPYKYGSVRSLIGEINFNQVFKTASRPKLVCGEPQVELLVENIRFLARPHCTTKKARQDRPVTP